MTFGNGTKLCNDCHQIAANCRCQPSAASAGYDLKPCPFCGGIVHIESNRDTHKLVGDHTDDCFFDDDTMMEGPAIDSAKHQMIQFWNKRS